METVPIIKQSFFGYCLATLQELNVSSNVIIEKAGIPHWEDATPEDVVPMEHVYRLLQTAVQITGSGRYGILTAQGHDVVDLAGLGQALHGRISVYDILSTASRLANKFSTTLRFWIERGNDGVWFCRRNLAIFPDLETGMNQLEMMTLTVMVDFVRIGAGPTWTPRAARMIGPPPKLELDWPEFQGTVFRYNHVCSAIFVPDGVLASMEAPTSTQIVAMSADAERKLQESWADIGLVASSRALLSSLLIHGDANLENLADAAGVSPRTLQRRLNEEDTSFNRLRDEVRFEKARQLLAHPDLSVLDVSHSVGYQNLPHFTRAFRRWSGLTPTRYRHTLMPPGSDVRGSHAVQRPQSVGADKRV